LLSLLQLVSSCITAADSVCGGTAGAEVVAGLRRKSARISLPVLRRGSDEGGGTAGTETGIAASVAGGEGAVVATDKTAVVAGSTAAVVAVAARCRSEHAGRRGNLRGAVLGSGAAAATACSGGASHIPSAATCGTSSSTETTAGSRRGSMGASKE